MIVYEKILPNISIVIVAFQNSRTIKKVCVDVTQSHSVIHQSVHCVSENATGLANSGQLLVLATSRTLVSYWSSQRELGGAVLGIALLRYIMLSIW